MSEDKHYTEPMPGPDALQDHEPTDKRAAKGIVYVIAGVFIVSLIAFAVIYYNENVTGDPGQGAPPSGQHTPAS